MKKLLVRTTYLTLLFLALFGLFESNAFALGTLQGYVYVSGTATPIPYAWVNAYDGTNWSFSDTDASGYYSSLTTTSGSNLVVVQASGYYDLVLEDFNVSEGGPTDQNFYLEPIDGQLLGYVCVAGSNPCTPIPDAWVDAYVDGVWFGTTSLSDGSYFFETASGLNNVYVWAEGYQFLTENVTVSDTVPTTHNFYLQPLNGAIQGKVCVAGSNPCEPIPYAWIDATDGNEWFYAYSDANGDYYLATTIGSINVEVWAEGYQLLSLNNISVSGGGPVTQDFYLLPLGTTGDDHCNQALSCATTLNVNGGAVAGNIETAGDVDYFKFNATSGGSYVIETSDLGSGSDTYIYLYSTNGATQIAYNDDGGEEGLASRIEWTATATGTFFVKVRHFSSAGTGTYKIAVTSAGGVSDDHCNTIDACATVITVNGSSVPGNIEVGGDEDWFQFTAVAGLTYEVETLNLGSGSDTMIFLFSSDEEFIAFDDDGGEGLASKITWTADSSGVFYVGVLHFDSAGTGSYSIRVKAYDDHCNTAGSCATHLIPNFSTVQGAFEIDYDADWFKFYADDLKEYVIETSNLVGGADTYIYLYGPDGATQIAYNDDGGEEGLASKITWTSPDSWGVYYIKVRHYSSTGRGTYSISVTGEDDHTRNIYVATLLPTSGEHVPGIIDYDGDLDLFTFSAVSGRTYVIETSNLGSGCDTIIKLYNNYDFVNPLAVDDDGGEAKITYTATYSGDYYVGVWHWSETGRGYYEINVQEQDDHPDSSTSVSPPPTTITVDSSSVPGRFESQGDEDWFQFTATANTRYVIQTGDLEAGCDTFMELYSTDGSTLLVSNDDGGSGLASRIDWAAPTSNTFYVRLRHFSPYGTGSYSIWIQTINTGGDTHADTYGGATEVIPGDPSIPGAIDVPGDVDWFSFNAVINQQYEIETGNLGTGCDTVIELYSADGQTLLVVNDDGGDGLGSRIVWTATSTGTFYVRVRHFSSTGTGTYNLAIQDTAGCDSITAGVAEPGNLSQTGDSVLYCLYVNAGDPVTVTLNGPASPTDFDLYLKLGAPPSLSDYDVRGFTSTSQETCNLTASSEGWLYIWVRSYSGTGTYSLQANVGSHDCIPITSNDDIKYGTLSGEDDGRLYCRSVNGGDRVLVELDGPVSGADFDLYLRYGSPPTLSVYDARGYTPFADETLAMTALESGTLYIWVVSYSGSGNYSLQAQTTNVPACTELFDGDPPLGGSLSATGGEVLYCFDVLGEGEYQVDVSLSSSETGVDFDLYLKFGAAPTPTDFDAVGYSPTANENVSIVVTGPGRVYILVKSYYGAGSYQVLVGAVSPLSLMDKTGQTDLSGSKYLIYGTIKERGGSVLKAESFCITSKDSDIYCHNSTVVGAMSIAMNANNEFVFSVIDSSVDANAFATMFEISSIQCYKNPVLVDYSVTTTAGSTLVRLVFEVDLDVGSNCDGDNMLADWEKRYGLNIWKNDADLDLDGDGYSNFEEFQAGSDPSAKNSTPNGNGKTIKAMPWIPLLLLDD